LAKPSPERPALPHLLVLELWGLGDLALALPFLRSASNQARVTLLAKPHAAPLLARFAPAVELIPLTAPWTAFDRKYRLLRWPWRSLTGVVRQLRSRKFDVAVSGRPDPRNDLLLALSGARKRIGFSRPASKWLLTDPLPPTVIRHRAEHWRTVAARLGISIERSSLVSRTGRRVLIHPGAAHRVRIWPRERYDDLAGRMRAAHWDVGFVDLNADLNQLVDTLASADRFVGNDSGPGHVAALLGVPTFTIFGPQLPELFAPQHPESRWIEGAPCCYKPCFDSCRYAQPHCLLDLSVDLVWTKLSAWLQR
jgi:ADP-heptose:LPS heptosyltransferase